MTRKIIFLFALSLILMISTAFAQQKTDNFLGTWKLDASRTKSSQKLGFYPMTMTVTEANDNLVIERSSQNPNGVSSIKDVYEIDGDTKTSVVGGFLGGVEYRRVRLLKSDKLQFLTTVQNDYSVRTTRATWVISEDGKTLTVQQSYRTSPLELTGASGVYISTKMIFTKQ